MLVKEYKVTDIETGEQHWFGGYGAELDCIKYAFGYDKATEEYEAAESLSKALAKGQPTFGFEQFLGLKVEEQWVVDEI